MSCNAPTLCHRHLTTADSDTTKDRFISAYHLPDQPLIRSSEAFNSVVLELVKLIQAGLSVFGMFDLDRVHTYIYLIDSYDRNRNNLMSMLTVMHSLFLVVNKDSAA